MASTIRNVATYAGLSLGTVSKYINGGSVKEANRKRIEAAIQALNYRPNNIAKGLRNAQSFTVAVIVPMLSSSFASVIISSIEEFLLPLGYCVIVSECHDDEEVELQKIQFLINRMVDGIILLPFSERGKQIEMLKDSGTPYVLIDQTIPNYPSDCVLLDNEEAIYEPTNRLIEMGHTEIVLITGNPALFTAQGRISGYQKAMAKHELPIKPHFIRNGEYSMDGAYQAIMGMHKGDQIPSAIIVSNYEMTLGAVLALNLLSIKAPEDLSFIGFDNLPLAKVVTPSLSIVTQPMEEMGFSAARLLYNRMQGDYDSAPETVVHKASMILRGSIANHEHVKNHS